MSQEPIDNKGFTTASGVPYILPQPRQPNMLQADFADGPIATAFSEISPARMTEISANASTYLQNLNRMGESSDDTIAQEQIAAENQQLLQNLAVEPLVGAFLGGFDGNDEAIRLQILRLMMTGVHNAEVSGPELEQLNKLVQKVQLELDPDITPLAEDTFPHAFQDTLSKLIPHKELSEQEDLPQSEGWKLLVENARKFVENKRQIRVLASTGKSEDVQNIKRVNSELLDRFNSLVSTYFPLPINSEEERILEQMTERFINMFSSGSLDIIRNWFPLYENLRDYYKNFPFSQDDFETRYQSMLKNILPPDNPADRINFSGTSNPYNPDEKI